MRPGIIALLLFVMFSGCGRSSNDETADPKELTGYALFSNESSAILYPLPKRNAFVYLVYDAETAPPNIRLAQREGTGCMYRIYNVRVLGEEVARLGLRHPFVEVRKFISVEPVSPEDLNRFIAVLDSAAINSDSVCSTQAS